MLDEASPFFDELFQHLAAITQALAFLEIVKKGESFARQIGNELKAAVRDLPAPIGAELVGGGLKRMIVPGKRAGC